MLRKPFSRRMLKYYWLYSSVPILLLFISTLLLSVCKAKNAISKTKLITFKKHIISKRFVSEGITVGDVNNDGNVDILAGHYWFEAPYWKPHLCFVA